MPGLGLEEGARRLGGFDSGFDAMSDTPRKAALSALIRVVGPAALVLVLETQARQVHEERRQRGFDPSRGGGRGGGVGRQPTRAPRGSAPARLETDQSSVERTALAFRPRQQRRMAMVFGFPYGSDAFFHGRPR